MSQGTGRPIDPPTLVQETDAEALAGRLAGILAEDLRQAVSRRGVATLAVSGGGTPRPLFQRLRKMALPWSQISVTLADERFVPPDHPDSNEAFVRHELLQDRAAKAPFVGLWSPADHAGQAAQAAESTLARLPWPLDVVILGMGGDGHTASLFPDRRTSQDNLVLGFDLESARRCIDMYPSEAPHDRLSLTLPALVDCRRLVLHITGQGKRRVLQQALAGGDDHELPIRAVLRQTRRPVEVFWAP